MADTDLTVAAMPIPFKEEPDAHGQAALLLAESILHALVEGKILSTPEAVEVLKTAAEVKVEIATAEGESNKRMNESLELLERMRASFQANEPDGRNVRPIRTLDPS